MSHTCPARHAIACYRWLPQQPAPSHSAAHACCQLLQRRPRLVGVVHSTNVSITGVRLRGERQKQASPCLQHRSACRVTCVALQGIACIQGTAQRGKRRRPQAGVCCHCCLPPASHCMVFRYAALLPLAHFCQRCPPHPPITCRSSVLVPPRTTQPAGAHITPEHPRRLGHPQQRR